MASSCTGAPYSWLVRVMVAMSGGVDSSVAAALLADDGHEVVGVTLKLWGGDSDSGCCSVSDVDDARRVAEQIGVDHHTFDLVSDFEASVVDPYVAAHSDGRTPNPCVECNRHVKFGRLLDRARRLGFDLLATGHHARVDSVASAPRTWRLRRGVDSAKDQSYVLSMLTQSELSRLVLPVGEMTKDEVRRTAARLGLRTASKPDSQDVCFIRSDTGRSRFLGERMALHPGEIVDSSGRKIGAVDAIELVTVGQRRGLDLGGNAERRYAVNVDVPARRVVVDGVDKLATDTIPIGAPTWVAEPLAVGAPTLVQSSAHGRACAARYGIGALRLDATNRAVAPGQTVALYDACEPDTVVGSAIAA